jgi:hypothetical protein
MTPPYAPSGKIGNCCPFCDTEILLDSLEKHGVKPKQDFGCHSCGAKLQYTVIQTGIGPILHLHLVDEKRSQVIYGTAGL